MAADAHGPCSTAEVAFVAKILVFGLLVMIVFTVVRVREPEFREGCAITKVGGPAQSFPDDLLCSTFYDVTIK
jgi:hypothetical protein